MIAEREERGKPLRTSTKLGLLASLYFSQGLPFGFFGQALPVLMRDRGHSLEEIGLTSLLAIPWGLKFLLAPFVDRFAGSPLGPRRGFILPLQILTAATLVVLAFIDASGSIGPVLACVFATNALAATQDIATDGMAVDLLTAPERGLGNGIQVSGYRAGMIVGGGFLLVVFDHFGWKPTFFGLAGAIAVATIPIALYREPRRAGTSSAPSFSFAAAREWFARPGLASWLVLLLVYKSGEWFATAMLRTFLRDAGVSMSDIGVMLGTVGFSAGLVGSLLGGWLVSRWGRRPALVIFGFVQALSVAAYAVFRAGASMPALYALSTFEHLASGMATASLFTAMMDACRPEVAATDYTVQACAVVIAAGGASAVSGWSAHHLGYSGHFALAAALCVAGAIYATLYRPRHGAFRLLSGEEVRAQA